MARGDRRPAAQHVLQSRHRHLNVGTRKVDARGAADRLLEDLFPAKAEESAHEYTIEEEELTV